MLYILFSCIFLLPVLSGFGKLNEFFLGRFNSSLSGKLLSGIFLISLIWLGLAFFIPINFAVESVTILVGLSSFFYFKIYKSFWTFFSGNYKIFVPVFLVVLFSGSFFPFILDHFGYYIPTIQWISGFGLVKGISNLDLLLGQMSVWHIFQAGFSHFSDPFLRMNTIILVVYLVYIFEKKSWLHLFFVPVLFLFVQTPSPDLPVIIFSLIILNEIFSGNRNSSFLFAFSALVFAIKPTMIWLPVFIFLHTILILKSNFKFIFSGSLVIILFIIKNLWCFGFPIFPVQIADLGISWKPNPELLKISSQTAIEKTFDMQYKYSEIQHFSVFQYIKNWFFLKGIKSKIHILFIVSLAILTFYSFIKKNKIVSVLCIAVLFKSLLVLVFSAQYRFFIDVFFVIVFVLFYQKSDFWKSFFGFTVLSIFFLGFLSFPNLVKTVFPSFKLGQFMMGFQKEQFIKPSYFEWKKYKTHQIGNLKFNVVEKYPFSFDVPIPAISPEFLKEDFDAGIFPQQNSENIKDGFHWKKLSPEEKLQLAEILKEHNY